MQVAGLHRGLRFGPSSSRSCGARHTAGRPCMARAGKEGGGLLGGLFGRKKAESKEAQIIALQEAVPEAVPEAGAPPPVPKQASVDTYMMYTPSDAKPEFPPFQTIKKGPIYDLRFYELYPVVEMEYTRREEGYAALGGYIDGSNSSGQPFSYTQPVVMRYEPSGKKYMSMNVGSVRGSGYKRGDPLPPISEQLKALPAPKDDSVGLTVAGGELVAILSFDGFITPGTTADAKKRLKAALAADGIKLAEEEDAGLFRVGQYGAVYSVEERMNELMFKVKAG